MSQSSGNLKKNKLLLLVSLREQTQGDQADNHGSLYLYTEEKNQLLLYLDQEKQQLALNQARIWMWGLLLKLD